MDDFFTSGPTLALVNAIFRHVEGYDGLPDVPTLHAFSAETAARRRTTRSAGHPRLHAPRATTW